MLPRQPVPRSLTRLAAVQDGVLSRSQCCAAGLGEAVVRRLLVDGTWRRIDAGMYAVANAEPGWDQLASAGVLLGGEGARLAGRSAAWLHKLVDSAEHPIDVLAPTDVADRSWVRFRRERPGTRRLSGPAWPPRLSVVDAVLDLCAAGEAEDVVTWISAAVQRRRATPAQLQRAIDARSRLRHRRIIGDVVADVAEGAHSHLEVRFLRDVERAHGLPRGQRQYAVPGTKKCADVAYPAFGVLVELDGAAWHGSAGARLRDRRRDNTHSGGGHVTYRYGWEDVAGAPCSVAAELGGALSTRGWDGLPRSCPRCPANVPDRRW